MNSFLTRSARLCLPALLLGAPLLADDDGGVAAALSCLACSGTLVLIPIVILVVNIALLVWVARDAKARGMDSPVLWMALVLFLSVVGLIIYVLSRPKGELVECQNCKNKRLLVSTRCPHCGAA